MLKNLTRLAKSPNGDEILNPATPATQAADELGELFRMEDPSASLDDDVERYISKEFFNVPNDIGKFWKEQSSYFKALSKVARSLLTIPATSAECERYFSKLARLITDYRSELSAKSVYSNLIANSIASSNYSF